MSASPDDMSSMMSSGMSDQDIQDMINKLGGISATPEKNQVLEQQIKLANSLRQKMPQGEMAGKVYVAPNALQSLSAAGMNTMANQQGQQAAQQMGVNANDQQAARTAYMKALAQALRQNQQPQSPSQSMNVAQGSDFNDVAGNMA